MIECSIAHTAFSINYSYKLADNIRTYICANSTHVIRTYDLPTPPRHLATTIPCHGDSMMTE